MPSSVASVRIGIIDTGIDRGHPEFQSLAYFNYAEVRQFTLSKTAAASDPHGHGTAVAALVAGEGVGTIPGCSLAVCGIEVDPRDPEKLLNGAPSIAQAIEWLVYEAFRRRPSDTEVPDVIVCSQGITFDSQLVRTAVEDAVNLGVTFVAAVGHSLASFTGCWYPAAYHSPPVIAVGATDQSGNRWPRSAMDNTNNPTVSAPGVAVNTASRGGGYGPRTGTSFAAPIAGGIIARELAGTPRSPQAMKQWLETSGQNVDPTTRGNGRGAGVIRLGASAP